MTNPKQDAYVRTQVERGIAHLSFFHPAHNSLPSNLLSQLVDQINAAGENPEVKIILLESGGERTFCAGASFDELISIQNEEEGFSFFMGFANVINAIRKSPKIVIGKVQGKAVGGGVGLASAVDYCLATKYAAVKLSELAIGIGPFVIEPAVSRKIGLSAMSQLALFPTAWKDAHWAKDQGLYAAVFESKEELDQQALELAQSLSTYNPQAMQAFKKVLWEGTAHWDELLAERAQTSGSLVLSDFSKQALAKIKG